MVLLHHILPALVLLRKRLFGLSNRHLPLMSLGVSFGKNVRKAIEKYKIFMYNLF